MFGKTGVLRAAIVVGVALLITSCTTFPPPGPPASGDGCAKPATAVLNQPASVAVGGTARNYTWTASDRTGPKPLVIDLHGLLEGVYAPVHPEMSQYSPKALQEGFVVAFPIGENNGLNWDLGANTASLQFIDQLLTQVKADACIDARRIYVTGLSYGAAMTTQIMCYRSEVFAAAAPVAGLLPPLDCHPTRKIPVVTFHGTADPILPFGLFSPSPQAWATLYGCGATTRTTVVESDPVTLQPIYRDTWACTDTAVESYVIEGGGHAWPGSAFSTLIHDIVGLTPTSISATDISWDFFTRFALPE